jgi:hypothetical protein
MIPELERVKLELDYVKHIATLSSGSLLLLVTLAEKVFPNAQAKWLVGSALLFFCGSIAATGFYGFWAIKTASASEEREAAGASAKDHNLGGWTLICAAGGFILGMILLLFFGWVNL